MLPGDYDTTLLEAESLLLLCCVLHHEIGTAVSFEYAQV